MSKAFTKENDSEPEQPEIPVSKQKNYVTPFGFSELQDELRKLLNDERPKIVESVRWAAGNGDRSENADYIYGKRRLREIDRRVRYLTKRLESAIVVDPQQQKNLTKVFFGATVTYKDDKGKKHVVKIVGTDEADLEKGKISWVSPVAKSLLKAEVDDVVTLRTPKGKSQVTIIAIEY